MHLIATVFTRTYYSASKYILQCSYDESFTFCFYIQGGCIVQYTDCVDLGYYIVDGELYSSLRYNSEEYHKRGWVAMQAYGNIYQICSRISADQCKLHITAEDDDYLRKLYTSTIL